jgi:hypothetical protein
MTYIADGRQYLVIAVSGNDYPGELIAYRVPRPRGPGASARGGPAE